MDEATKHRNRHRAIAGMAKMAVVNIAELQAWLDVHGHSEDLPLVGRVNPATSWLLFYDLTHKASTERVAQVEASRVPDLLREYELAADPEDLAAARKALDVPYLSSEMRDRKLLAALHEAKLDRLLLGAAYDSELRLYRLHGKNRHLIDFTEAKAEYDANPDVAPRIERVDYWAMRQPAPLYGVGFSDEVRKITRLTRHLELDTWTPTAAALLVCGIDPPANCNAIPEGAFDLTGAWQAGSFDAFHIARRVLELWDSQENAPAKVRPAEFVFWCRSKGINTDWLHDVPNMPAANKAALDGDVSTRTMGTSVDDETYALELEGLSRPAIKKLFPEISDTSWRGVFQREETNGLGECRADVNGRPRYDQRKLAVWITNNRNELNLTQITDRLQLGSPGQNDLAKSIHFPTAHNPFGRRR